MKKTPDQICKRFDNLKSNRGTTETHWQDCIDYTMPNMRDVIRQKTPGEKKGAMLFDNTGMTAAEMLSSALHGTLTNPNTEWFELLPSVMINNPSEAAKIYLQEFTTKIHRLLNGSNFQTEVHQFYLDLCVIGTAVMTVEPDERKVFGFGTRHISECVIAENNKGMVEELYRTFKWTASQVLQEFTKDQFGNSVDVDELIKTNKKGMEEKFGEGLIDAYVSGKSTEFTIIHAVYRDDLTSYDGKPFLSQYILRTNKEKKELRSKGFRRFPYLVARWIKQSNEIYGRSPAMTALPSMKSVNQMQKAVIKAAQKVVDPPIQMPDDGFIRPQTTAPGSIHYYRAGTTDRVEAIFKDINPRIGLDLINSTQNQIREAFFVDKLNLLQGDRMTTVEVNQRIEEQLRFLAPMLGRQRFEFLIPLIDLLVDILVEKASMDADFAEKFFGEPPEDIADVALSVEYTSPIARAQIITQGQNMVRALEASAQFIAIDQDAADVINAEEAIRQNWKVFGAPQKVLRTQGELEEIKAARAEAQAQAVQQQQGLAEAETLSKVAPVLKA